MSLRGTVPEVSKKSSSDWSSGHTARLRLHCAPLYRYKI
jgi:hypothetical protein